MHIPYNKLYNKIAEVRGFLIALAVVASAACALMPNSALASNAVALSAKISGPNAVTIIFSEPVYASVGDFLGVSGSLSGKTASGISGSGSNTITLTYSGFEFADGATAGLSIGSSLRSVSTNTQFLPTTVAVIDGQVPRVTSLSISSSNSSDANGSFSSTGAAVTVVFSSSKPVTSSTATIGGHPVQVTGSNNGPYAASYALTSSDEGGTIPIVIFLTDAAGNASRVTTGFVTGVMPAISAITSNASGNGPLGVGASIRFTLVPNAPLPGASVNGSYDGTALSWITSNGGQTYTATYVVDQGAGNQTFPLQISGVTITDRNGNVSSPASGTDIGKFVDTNYTAATAAAVTAVPASVRSAMTTAALSVAKPALPVFVSALRNGSAGKEVRALQSKLLALGFFKGTATGTFGNATEAALKKFQANHGLSQTGAVGPATRSLLNK